MTDQYELEMAELYKRTLSSESRGEFKGLVCPSTYKKPCRLCDLCKEVLFDRSIPKDAPLRKRASSLNQKHKYYSNILVLPDISTVVIFEYGDKIFNQLIQGQMDDLSEWKNFMHPVQGRNLYLSKIQGASKEQVDYKVEPRMTATALMDKSVLKSIMSPLYNLSDIVALMDSGKVKTIYQSKLVPDVGKIEVRILPSWLGPGTAKFYEKVNYHYNITKEEFESTLAGKYDPIRMSHSAGEQVMAPESQTTTWPSEWETEEIPPQQVREEISQSGTNVDGDEEAEEIPNCFGQYDEENLECTSKCFEDGWGESCKFQYEEKKKQQERRKKARLISR